MKLCTVLISNRNSLTYSILVHFFVECSANMTRNGLCIIFYIKRINKLSTLTSISNLCLEVNLLSFTSFMLQCYRNAFEILFRFFKVFIITVPKKICTEFNFFFLFGSTDRSIYVER